MEKPCGFYSPLHLFLSLRLEKGTQGIEQLEPAVLVSASFYFSDQRQKPLDHLGVDLPK